MNQSFSDTSDLHLALLNRLLSLPFTAFTRCLADLLRHMGYTDIVFSPRKDWRGSNGKDGVTGYDLRAQFVASGITRTVLVLVKQFDEKQRIFHRHIDQLRGACLRLGASEGLLLTSGSISPKIDRTTLAAQPFAPVRCIDGEELLYLLLRHRVGIHQERGTEAGIDTAYFDRLTKESAGNGREDCFASSDLTITVAVEPTYRKKRTDSTLKPHHAAR